MKTKYQKYEIKTVNRKDIRNAPYNPRTINQSAKNKLKKNIKQIGLLIPLVVNKNTMNLVSGHQRLSCLDILEGNSNYEIEVSLCDLTEKQEKAQNIFFNNSKAQGNFELSQLDVILKEIDYNEAGFDLSDVKELELKMQKNDLEEYLVEEPKITTYNNNVFFPSKNIYDIPTLRDDMFFEGSIDDICFGTNDKLDITKTYLCLYGQHKIEETAKNNIIGFFVDDERFGKIWNDAVDVLEKFKKISPKALITPNFSIWADEPLPYSLMAWYKTQWCGRYWQEAGFKIIPSLNWGTKKTYDFCFLGLPKDIPVVAIQCRNIKTKQEKNQFLDGLLKAKEIINFKKLYCYGKNIIEFDKILKEQNNIDYSVIRSWQDKKTESKY